METTDRMMIAGLALQGLLANPRNDCTNVKDMAQLSLMYAAELEGKTPDSQGEPKLVKIVRICAISYNVYYVYMRGRLQTDMDPSWAQTWQELDPDSGYKMNWYEVVQALIAHPNDAGYVSAMGQDLTPDAVSIINAVISGWLDADG